MNSLPTITGVTIQRKIGEGGQGEVFAATHQGAPCALKLYTTHNSTDDQRTIIDALVSSGPPSKEFPHRFAWPQQTVQTDDGSRFGYLMRLVDTQSFNPLSAIAAGNARHPGFGIMAQAGCHLVDCYRDTHIDGFCIRDISDNNFLIDFKTAEVVLIDNDNIVPNKLPLGSMVGTPGFMAPEVVLGHERPSTATDHHSLAVLLFTMLCGGHPLHGQNEDNIKIFDNAAQTMLYGTNPVFVFDPCENSNRLPKDKASQQVKKYWLLLPGHIQDLFTRAFTTGLTTPSSRVTDLEWKHALIQLLDQRLVCGCGAENFWDPDAEHQKVCWNKGCEVGYPAKLRIHGSCESSLLIKPGVRVTSMHFGEKSSASVLAVAEKHPGDENQCVLRNKTAHTWTSTYGTETTQVPPDRAVSLPPGLEIATHKGKLTVQP